jgi:DNA primase catalytic core
MLISKETIDKVKDLPLLDVIRPYVELKKTGANWMGKSPFKDEKTASFSVNTVKGIYKCFATGKGGNQGVSFLMEYKSCEYIEAIKELAKAHSIEIKVESNNPEEAKIYIEKQKHINKLYELNLVAHEYLIDAYKKCPQDQKRTTPEMDEKFGIGFGDGDFKSLLKHLTEKGYSHAQIIECGLASKTAKGTFDFWNNRILFPIHNYRGVLLGFGGRSIDPNPKGKYINTKDTPIFNKSKELFGLHLALDKIQKTGIAHTTEGFTDVTTMHQFGITNTVASLGTAFTQAGLDLLIKNGMKTIKFSFDGDGAGLEATRKGLRMAFRTKNLNAEVWILPEGQDPDSFLKSEIFKSFFVEEKERIRIDECSKFNKKALICDIDETNKFWKSKSKSWNNIISERFIQQNTIDGVEWYVDDLYRDADTIPKQAEAETAAVEVISSIPDEVLRNRYINTLKSTFTGSVADVKSLVNKKINAKKQKLEEDDNQEKIHYPPGCNQEGLDRDGYVHVYKPQSNQTGYYFPTKKGKHTYFESISTFIMTPLYHILGKKSERILRFQSKDENETIPVPSSVLLNPNQLRDYLSDFGYFLFDGKPHMYNIIMRKVMQGFEKVNPIAVLGWHEKEFFAFADGIMGNNIFSPVDEEGIVRFNDETYYLPAFSSFNKHIDEGNDEYESDRNFVYKKATVDFAEWTDLFIKVHGENGIVSLAFVLLTTFRDHVFKVKTTFPILFFFGPSGYGKSFHGKSLYKFYFSDQPVPFNLNSGTPVAFSRKLARQKNVLAWFDEFQLDIKPQLFQKLKGIYDGAGHEKGIMSQDNRTITTKVNNAALVSGQHLPSLDGGSLFNRSIVNYYLDDPREFSADKKDQAKQLKTIEDKGLSSLLLEIVKYRDLVTEDFAMVCFETEKDIKKELGNRYYNDRVYDNYCMLLAIVRILHDKIPLGFTAKKFKKIIIERIVKQSAEIQNTDALGSFWSILEYNIQKGLLTKDVDYKFKRERVVSVRGGKKELPKETTLIFIRFSKVYGEYSSEYFNRNKEKAIDEASIKNYFSNHESYVATTPMIRFADTNTSAYVFDYDKLNISIMSDDDKGTLGIEVETEETALQASNISQDDLPF